jgi:hypothetical protein
MEQFFDIWAKYISLSAFLGLVLTLIARRTPTLKDDIWVRRFNNWIRLSFDSVEMMELKDHLNLLVEEFGPDKKSKLKFKKAMKLFSDKYYEEMGKRPTKKMEVLAAEKFMVLAKEDKIQKKNIENTVKKKIKTVKKKKPSAKKEEF